MLVSCSFPTQGGTRQVAPDSSPTVMDELAACRPQVLTLVARLLRRTESDPDVQDCAHESLRRALENRERLRPGEPVKPWLLGIARHVAMDVLRGEYRKRSRIHAEPPSGPTESLVERQADPSPSPEALAESRRLTRDLALALEGLPPEQREALLLFHREGLGYKEIAERLKVPTATVGTWILRARKHLASKLTLDDLAGEGN